MIRYNNASWLGGLMEVVPEMALELRKVVQLRRCAAAIARTAQFNKPEPMVHTRHFWRPEPPRDLHKLWFEIAVCDEILARLERMT